LAHIYIINCISRKMCFSHPSSRKSTVTEQIHPFAVRTESWYCTKAASKIELMDQMECDSAFLWVIYSWEIPAWTLLSVTVCTLVNTAISFHVQRS
jgi:hypothetical protein